MRTATLYESSGTHPLIQEYNRRVKELKDLDFAVNAAHKAAKHPTKRYRVSGVYVDVFFDPTRKEWKCPENGRIPKASADSPVRFHLTLSNKEELEADINTWGYGAGSSDTDLHSVGYRLVNPTPGGGHGVLCRVGGGSLVIGGFDEVITMSEEEWQQCLTGHIPDRVRPEYIEP